MTPVHIQAGDRPLAEVMNDVTVGQTNHRSMSPDVVEFLNDWRLVLKLRLTGERIDDIAEKWGISKYSAGIYLKPWVEWHNRKYDNLIPMSQFIEDDDLPNSFAITVHGIVKYKVSKI